MVVKRGQRILVLGPNGAGAPPLAPLGVGPCRSDRAAVVTPAAARRQIHSAEGAGRCGAHTTRGCTCRVWGAGSAARAGMCCIAGTVDLWQGRRELGDRVKLAVFSQDLAQVPSRARRPCNSMERSSCAMRHTPRDWGAQDLPMEKPALDYVLDTAREDDITVTLERGRQALGALGLSGSMALRKISACPP